MLLAAGSLGSTELLLRARDDHRTPPYLSARLGHGWSPNANVFSMGISHTIAALAERIAAHLTPQLT